MTTIHGRADPIPWPAFGRPTSFVVDREGTLRRIVVGARSFEAFARAVERWL